jgi:hypothetical protein
MKLQTFYEHLHKIFHLAFYNVIMFLLWVDSEYMSDFAHLYASYKFCFNNDMCLSLDHHSTAHYT